MTLTWTADADGPDGAPDNADDVAPNVWEVRWRLNDEAYSVDDWHNPVDSFMAEVNPDPSDGENRDGVQRSITFAATDQGNNTYRMTAVVGVTAAGAGGDLRNFAEYELQVRNGTNANDQTPVRTVSRTPAAPPEEVDDLDAEPGIRKVTLEWDRASSNDRVTKWQVFYYDAALEEARSIMAMDLVTEENEDEVKAVDEPMPSLGWMNIANSDADTTSHLVEGLNSGTGIHLLGSGRFL